jgi:tetratricopeptide (TPR) repeat protein
MEGIRRYLAYSVDMIDYRIEDLRLEIHECKGLLGQIERNLTPKGQAEHQVGIAMECSLRGRYELAFKHLNKAVDLYPCDWRIYATRAFAKERKSDINGAIADYNECLSWNFASVRERSTVLLLKARAEYVCKRYHDALDVALHAIQSDPQNPEAVYAVGHYAALDGDNRIASKYLREAFNDERFRARAEADPDLMRV